MAFGYVTMTKEFRGAWTRILKSASNRDLESYSLIRDPCCSFLPVTYYGLLLNFQNMSKYVKSFP